MKEGAHLYGIGVDPYEGDIYHENPFILIASSFLLNNFRNFMSLIFIVMDLMTAVFIYYGAKGITKRNVKN